MDIGIIVYSQGGNTLSVAEKLKDKLAASGHTVALERVEIEGEVKPGPGGGDVTLKSAPAVDRHKGIVFAAPVQAFSLAAAMKGYLNRIGSMEDTKFACLVTKQLKGNWTGGNSAVRKMKKIGEEKGGTFLGSEIVIWSSGEREKMIEDAVEELAGLFT